MHVAYKQTVKVCMQIAPKSAGDMTGYGLVMQYKRQRACMHVSHGASASSGIPLSFFVGDDRDGQPPHLIFSVDKPPVGRSWLGALSS